MGIIRSTEFGTYETFYRSNSKRGVYACRDSLGPRAHSRTEKDVKLLNAETKLDKVPQHSGAKRVLRKAEKTSRRSGSDGENPDFVGLRWGHQEPLY